ncbi:hypothetical protein [Noviherbaspirillum autotrophicum]|uniref:Uncharacterized protein n=1 Tax=Noviherbaspirillum autotrophicum TaxID=709839 RepID=A0A0C2C161_9BURK|nr:hypothetical protein [Noviherbaspirillum autotrophicum]KIF80793.1 hypothetical protein TSA66_08110 [Noviherbaspirillum autotrophicum]KIF80831.1 hypothetical protein TSA66_08355 [Noviherbaspirillum autotrophicum]KIF84056.1 hypothetical protein TSA66_01045 [Noviherbaspirillum autotrophicum]
MAARIAPTRMSLEIAHRNLNVTLQLDDMLKHPAYRIILENVARRHMQHLARFDAKKLQANDLD